MALLSEPPTYASLTPPNAPEQVNVARTVPTKAIQFAAFDAFKEALTVTDAKTGARTLPPWGGGVAGGLAGVASTCCMHPMETLQTRLAAGSYKGFGDCVVTLLRKEGPKALFGGLAPSLMGIIPYAGINLGSYDAMRTACVARRRRWRVTLRRLRGRLICNPWFRLILIPPPLFLRSPAPPPPARAGTCG